MANLASYLRNTNTGETAAIGIANKKLFEKEGKICWQALGGAARMFPHSKKYLEEDFGAQFLEKGDDVDDARFIISKEHEDAVVGLFFGWDDDDSFCEWGVMREVIHEFEQEVFQGETILKPGTLAAAYSEGSRTFRQESSAEGSGTSSRAQKYDIPTKRLFYVHTLCVSDQVFRAILASPYVVRLSEKELNTTQMGRMKGITKIGTPMFDNLCNWRPGYISSFFTRCMCRIRRFLKSR